MSYFINERVEACTSLRTYPKTHNEKAVVPDFKPKHPDCTLTHNTMLFNQVRLSHPEIIANVLCDERGQKPY